MPIIKDNYGDDLQVEIYPDGVYLLIDEGNGRRRAAVDLDLKAARRLHALLSPALEA